MSGQQWKWNATPRSKDLRMRLTDAELLEVLIGADAEQRPTSSWARDLLLEGVRRKAQDREAQCPDVPRRGPEGTAK